MGERTAGLTIIRLSNSRVGDMGVITRVECADATIAVVQFAMMPELRDPASIGITQILSLALRIIWLTKTPAWISLDVDWHETANRPQGAIQENRRHYGN